MNRLLFGAGKLRAFARKPRNGIAAHRRAGMPAFSVMLVCLLLCGCPATIITSDPGRSPGRTETPARRDMSLTGQARTAWNAGNMAEAERLYGIIARNPHSAPADRALAHERAAVAALLNQRPHSALETLDQWRAATPAADSQAIWQETWGQALLHLGDGEATRLADAVWKDATRPLPLRGMAGGVLMTLSPNAAEARAGELNTLYERAPAADRAALEQRLHTLLNHADDADIARLSGLTGPERDHLFPWTLVLLEDLVRARGGVRAGQLAARIDAPGVFADPSLVEAALRGTPATPFVPGLGSNVAFKSGCAALALPLSGPYAPVGRKVAAGATAAADVLSRNGQTMNVTLVDTDAPDWIERVNALPPHCVAVGGLLRAQSYTAARTSGLTASRAVFAFLSSLEGTDEGMTAWRFFSSADDQIAAMLRFTGRLGISAYGVLMPDDPYGRRMTEIFTRSVQAAGGSVSLASYTPGSATDWSRLMGRFVGSYMAGKTPMSSAKFQAVFLPDSWQNAEKMLPYLFYQGEDRLVLMGTALWEQGLAAKGRVNTKNMDLAVFPGAWNPHAATPARAALADALARAGHGNGPDVWNALGFDFVRLASALNLTEAGWTPASVNERLAEAQLMDWSMAPIRWGGGRAAQELFILHPTATGFEPVDEAAFKRRLDEIRARYARRRR